MHLEGNLYWDKIVTAQVKHLGMHQLGKVQECIKFLDDMHCLQFFR